LRRKDTKANGKVESPRGGKRGGMGGKKKIAAKSIEEVKLDSNMQVGWKEGIQGFQGGGWGKKGFI